MPSLRLVFVLPNWLHNFLCSRERYSIPFDKSDRLDIAKSVNRQRGLANLLRVEGANSNCRRSIFLDFLVRDSPTYAVWTEFAWRDNWLGCSDRDRWYRRGISYERLNNCARQYLVDACCLSTASFALPRGLLEQLEEAVPPKCRWWQWPPATQLV